MDVKDGYRSIQRQLGDAWDFIRDLLSKLSKFGEYEAAFNSDADSVVIKWKDGTEYEIIRKSKSISS